MKIQFIQSNKNRKINVQYNSILQYKNRNKIFSEDDYLGVLNFALSLPDRYLMAIPPEIYEWAQLNKHSILYTKNILFI